MSLLTCVNVAISILVSVCFSDNITSIRIIDDGLLKGYCETAAYHITFTLIHFK